MLFILLTNAHGTCNIKKDQLQFIFNIILAETP